MSLELSLAPRLQKQATDLAAAPANAAAADAGPASAGAFSAAPSAAPSAASCEHRSVSKGGQILCRKIIEGDSKVSPDVCRACPFKAVNCAHLCFSLQQTTPSPLVVRFNGRTEIWDDDPPEVRLSLAACAAKVSPITHPKQCAGCAQRQPLQQPANQAMPKTGGEHKERGRRRVVAPGKVVPFPGRRVAAAVG